VVFNVDDGSGRERRGVAMIACHLQLMVQSWLLHWRRFMVTVVVAIGLHYRVSTIVFSTRGCLNEKRTKHWDACFLFHLQ